MSNRNFTVSKTLLKILNCSISKYIILSPSITAIKYFLSSKILILRNILIECKNIDEITFIYTPLINIATKCLITINQRS